MATFTAIKDNVNASLRDSEHAFITDAQIGLWVNEAYLDLNARLGILRKSVADTFDANGEDTLPTDFIRMTSIAIETSTGVNTTPQIVSDEIFFSWKNLGDTPDATLLRIFDGKLRTYPAAASKPYSMEYVYKPAPLSAGADVPALPEELHIKLVRYGTYMAKLTEGELAEANTFFGLYIEGLPGAPNAISRDKPGPFHFVPEPSYWDNPA